MDKEDVESIKGERPLNFASKFEIEQIQAQSIIKHLLRAKVFEAPLGKRPQLCLEACKLHIELHRAEETKALVRI